MRVQLQVPVRQDGGGRPGADASARGRERAASTRARVRRALGFARAHRAGIAATASLSVVAAAVTATEPLVLRWLIDGLSRHAGAVTLLRGAATLGSILT